MTLDLARPLTLSLITLGVLTLSSRAVADDAKAQCIAAYESGQRAHKNRELLKAKREFAHCASDTCPAAMHDDCTGWLDEVNAAIPMVLFHVTGSDGEALQGVRVSIDRGAAQAFDGTAIAFDPGEHDVSFECSGYRPIKRRIALAEGEQSEPQALALEAVHDEEEGETEQQRVDPPLPERIEPVVQSERNMLPTLIGLGVGVLGTAGFVGFGLSARAGDRSLDGCTPNCSAHEVDGVRRNYVLANVSLGIAGAGFVGAGVLYVLSPRASTQARAARPRLGLRVGPVSYLTGEF